jgi:galactokinase/mevalonate kinase-like predicted kinase
MNTDPMNWDYLIVTASNDSQARSYEIQLNLRKKLGLLSGVNRVLVVPDPEGKRIGSGGSTIFALLKVLSRELRPSSLIPITPSMIREALGRLRILIIHAGGDSRRLPSYGPCGKIFTPLPGRSDSALGSTIFDRQFPIYRELPPSDSDKGQIVVTTGDVLLFFSPRHVNFRGKGVTGLGCFISPEQAKSHGVFSSDREGEVQYFLQKPSVTSQRKSGAIDQRGLSLLDIGVMEMDAASAAKLITLCEIERKNGGFFWTGTIAGEILGKGLDFYREICCSMGKKIRLESYIKTVRESGSPLSESFLITIFEKMSTIPFYVHPLRKCTFLHFGSPRQLIETGSELLRLDRDIASEGRILSINNHLEENGRIRGKNSWVEGCRIRSELSLSGENVVVGVDVDEPLSLPAQSCLDVIQGYDRTEKKAWFVRMYGIDDSFKDPKKNLWNEKIFPAVSTPDGYRDWLWMTNRSEATAEQIQAWQEADKYSLAEISSLVDLETFCERRHRNRAQVILASLGKIFEPDSRFSASDLASIFETLDKAGRVEWLTRILKEAQNHSGFIYSRIVHTVGSAIRSSFTAKHREWTEILQAAHSNLSDREKTWWVSKGLDLSVFKTSETWSKKARDNAFDNMSRTIVWSRKGKGKPPQCTAQKDEIIWGRAPARLDLGGGWTDTPPYSLEHGGCVINAAVDLEGKPPIHVKAKVLYERVIKIVSIDHDSSVIIKDMQGLTDYQRDPGKFGLAKAALVLSGFSMDKSNWPEGMRTLQGMLEYFGGGIELTTSAAIPSGSGLGTSSIMGAVLISVINKLIGKKTAQRELFNQVLQLEQELTTGGGWQDQIGGTIGGVKMITTEPGIEPDPKIQPVKSDVLDPLVNKGQTLLYYTGMRRMAKNILRNIVGNYLDRDRRTLEALHKLHVFPPFLVDAMENVDIKRFGELIDRALMLKKEIDPGSSNDEMEKILEKFKPHMIGATFLGAGGGGFLLVVCKSPADAAQARTALDKDPPNPQARFFDYGISSSGLEVTIG